ncbi:amidohydrolase family protein [Rhodococcus jostii]|uniref:Amidohydrolase-related domain-containing protein n=1 Tax=Rhodococcus jostii TaxID=132919 RepID=A0A1H4THG3_RHOJO|nr:amidohydrolase family protein [Rhodococcus jostii]SEC55708.1 hypothetical protein SAMN04490220_1944 [Rhodococcus jostii]
MSKVVDVAVNFRIGGGWDDSAFGGIFIKQRLGEGWDPEKGWDPDALIQHLDDAGIDMIGLISNVWNVGGQELFVHADEVKVFIDKFPDRVFGWVGINPLQGMETLRYIEYAVRDLGFKGVHCYPHWFGLPVNDRRYYPIYAKCAELGVPFAMQVGSPSVRAHAKMVARPTLLDDIAYDFPELKLVGLHVGTPFANEMCMLARNYENVFIIADAYPPVDWERDLLDYINQKEWNNVDGSDKVMWGTDHPVQAFRPTLQQVRDHGFTPDIEAKLLGDNAVRILNL